MNRYETFVIRLWIENEHSLDHGEIRHLTSGQSSRFQYVEDAFKFIGRFVAEPARTGSEPDSPPERSEHH